MITVISIYHNNLIRDNGGSGKTKPPASPAPAEKQRSTITDTKKKSSGSGGRRVTVITADGQKSAGTIRPKPGDTPDFYAQLGALYEAAYNDRLAANASALEAARSHARDTAVAQSKALGDQYAGTNRQLYRDYMESRRALPQQLAAMGYSGGLTESNLLRLYTDYAEGLNENERAHIAQQGEFDRALAEQLYAALTKRTDADNEALRDRHAQREALARAIFKDTQQRAAAMAASGDFSEYERLGFSPSEIAYLKQIWNRRYPTIAQTSAEV